MVFEGVISSRIPPHVFDFGVEQHPEAPSPPVQAAQAEGVGWLAAPPTARDVHALVPDLPKHLLAHSGASPLVVSTLFDVSPLPQSNLSVTSASPHEYISDTTPTQHSHCF